MLVQMMRRTPAASPTCVTVPNATVLTLKSFQSAGVFSFEHFETTSERVLVFQQRLM